MPVPVTINLNDAVPAAPTGYTNVHWQGDNQIPRNVTAYVNIAAIYHLWVYAEGLLTANEIIYQWPCGGDLPNGVAFATNLAGNLRGFLQANPTSTAVFTFYKIPAGSASGTVGSSIGTITVSTAGVLTVAFTATTFLPGDVFTCWAPATVDPTLAGPSFLVTGLRL